MRKYPFSYSRRVLYIVEVGLKMEDYDRRGDYDRRDARPRSESRGRGGGDYRRGGGDRGGDDYNRRGGDDYRRGGGDRDYRGGGGGGFKRDRGSSSLLVRNISYRVRADELRRIFSYYGEIRDVYIPTVSFDGPIIENMW